MEKTKNIYEKMQEVKILVGSLEKDLTVGSGSYGYKGISESEVLSKVNLAEKEVKLHSYIKECQILSSDRFTNAKGTIQFEDRIKAILEIVNLENPSEKVEVSSLALGLDSGDKGLGKAMTYAKKYALINAYKLTSGEDLDENKSEEQKASLDEMKVKIINILDQQEEMKSKILEHYKLNDLQEITEEHYKPIIASLNKKGLW